MFLDTLERDDGSWRSNVCVFTGELLQVIRTIQLIIRTSWKLNLNSLKMFSGISLYNKLSINLGKGILAGSVTSMEMQSS